MINLGGLLGSAASFANGINEAGQVVGNSTVGSIEYATDWSDGTVIDLGPGVAFAINNAGQIVGAGPNGATEWSGGGVINLEGLPGSTSSEALATNGTGQVVGFRLFPTVSVSLPNGAVASRAALSI